MTSDRFNELLDTLTENSMFSNLRLTMALRAVINGTGEVGDRAFEDFCSRGVAVASRGDKIVMRRE